ncbi:MAG: hypothetical protein LBC39_07335 [Methanobrevibacter sp.]|jgi:hypothetical protein|nr:hypothetical protein [Candidatus Methanovirga aequatorialis]
MNVLSDPLRVTARKLEKKAISSISDEVLLFQTGYLTVKRVEEIGNTLLKV